MKTHYSILGILFFASVLFGCQQSTSPKTSDPAGPSIYAGGYTGSGIPGYWNNGSWVSLSSLSSNGSRVNGIAVSGSDIYSGGWSMNGSGVSTFRATGKIAPGCLS
jgi:hypothetical protein